MLFKLHAPLPGARFPMQELMVAGGSPDQIDTYPSWENRIWDQVDEVRIIGPVMLDFRSVKVPETSEGANYTALDLEEAIDDHVDRLLGGVSAIKAPYVVTHAFGSMESPCLAQNGHTAGGGDHQRQYELLRVAILDRGPKERRDVVVFNTTAYTMTDDGTTFDRWP